MFPRKDEPADNAQVQNYSARNTGLDFFYKFRGEANGGSMNVKWRWMIRRSAVLPIVCFLTVSLAHGQSAPKAPVAPVAKEQMAEVAFKDVRLLKGIPADQFMDTMGFFAASLGLNCTDCHGEESSGSWAAYANDQPLKTTARKMIVMVRAINQANFGGTAVVTCNTCHRGSRNPQPRPSLAQQYADPVPGDPNDVVIGAQGTNGPTADQIFDKYLEALGGPQRVASLTSYVAKGNYEGWDTNHEKVPVDIFAKAPGERTTVVHTADGDNTSTFDGNAGWTAAPDNPLPVPIALTGGDLYGVKIDAMLSFPSGIKKAAVQWRVGSTTIGDDAVEVVQGATPGQLPLKLYFDKAGLLLREVHFTQTAVGQDPTQIDYSDYREVAGVKMPFKWVVTWTDGQATIQLSSVQPNVPIDPAKFAKPAPSANKNR